LQKDSLTLFAQLPDQDQFYLAGGTALAEYYLGHRLSFDLDLFTGQAGLIQPVSYQFEQRCAAHGSQVTVTRRIAGYAEFVIRYFRNTLWPRSKPAVASLGITPEVGVEAAPGLAVPSTARTTPA
jgi:hypothetical protein